MTEHLYDALIIGAGFGGLGAAAQLTRRGVRNFCLLEAGDEIGGVWRENTYPGAACDTQSVIYCYSYLPHLTVSRMYAGRDELLSYLRHLAQHFALTDHLRLGTRVVRAQWDESRSRWVVTDQSGNEFHTRALIPAWGQLGTPHVPPFDGLDTFRGTMFHSARWDHTADLTGKRVASIGAAASAVQYVPEIAASARQLVVFQRSANYILPRNQQVFTSAELDTHQSDPGTFHALRERIHNEREAGFDRTRRGTDGQREGADDAQRHLENQVADPALRAVLTPDYDFGCKRILRSDDYYPALTRPNVVVETANILRFTPDGVLVDNGEFYPLDVVVFGTGFASQSFQGDTAIIGRDGRSLHQRWGSTPEAYLGMLVDGFPNMFLVYGPNTNLNHNSIVAMLEVQHEFIAESVERLCAYSELNIDVEEYAIRGYNAWLQVQLEDSAFTSECSSWYKNSEGKVINNWCGTVEDYRRLVTARTRPEAVRS
ncbi:flavin-containing monooxygenase [Nocardia salmonicida]|uniref:flavin-containing monooxygenase n=1 Tax=Nocardia salmonicida TaxID=53431 RepID=UPI00378A9ED8